MINNMGQHILLMGTCLVSGLPGKSAPLPYIISKYLNQDATLNFKIKADSDNDNLEKMYIHLQEQLLPQEYDVIMLQFINQLILPGFHLIEQNEKESFLYKLLTFIKKIETKVCPQTFRSRLRLLWGNRREDHYTKKLSKCVEYIKVNNPDTQIILMTPLAPISPGLLPYKEILSNYRDQMLAIAKKYDLQVADVFEGLLRVNSENLYLKDDNFHLSRKGQQVMGEVVASVIKNNIKLSNKP